MTDHTDESPLDNLVTVRDWLRYAVSRFNAADLFFGHGSNNAFDEAAYLILHTLHLPLDRLEPFLDASLLPEEASSIAQMLDRRIDERLPAPYLTHEAWLQGYRFLCRSTCHRATLIPGTHDPGADATLAGRTGQRISCTGFMHRLGLSGGSDG
jgi:hypothetical protein